MYQHCQVCGDVFMCADHLSHHQITMHAYPPMTTVSMDPMTTVSMTYSGTMSSTSISPAVAMSLTTTVDIGSTMMSTVSIATPLATSVAASSYHLKVTAPSSITTCTPQLDPLSNPPFLPSSLHDNCSSCSSSSDIYFKGTTISTLSVELNSDTEESSSVTSITGLSPSVNGVAGEFPSVNSVIGESSGKNSDGESPNKNSVTVDWTSRHAPVKQTKKQKLWVRLLISVYHICSFS